MRTTAIEQQILHLLEAYCEPEAVAEFMGDLADGERFEENLITIPANPRVESSGESLLNRREKVDQLITLCHTRLAGPKVTQLILQIGDVFRRNGDLVRAEEMYGIAINRGELSGSDGDIAEAFTRRAEVYCCQGRWKESSNDLRLGRKLFRQLKQHTDVARVDNILGTNLVEQGKLIEAKTHLKKALRTFVRTDAKLMEGSVLMNLGIVSDIIGDYDEALLQYQRALSYFAQDGNLTRLAQLHHNIGMTNLHRADYIDAIGEFEESIRLAVQAGEIALGGLARLGKAYACFHLRDFTFSLCLASQVIRCFDQAKDHLGMADTYKLKGMIHRELDRPDSAILYFQTSLRINRELRCELNAAETLYEWGLLEKRRRQHKQAREHFKAALAGFSRIGAKAEARKTEQELKTPGESKQ